jgi:murein DD-endopeptidase MepM/ murein hydrolase activator NlpD
MGKFQTGPVPTNALVTSAFEAQEAGLRTSPHRGVDFGVPVGTPVVAPDDGVVERCFFDSGGGGMVIFLYHPQHQVRTAYLHLSSFNVSDGKQVRAGDRIALSGNTGNSTGPHLHFEVRRPATNGSDERLNPADWLPVKYTLTNSAALQARLASIGGPGGLFNGAALLGLAAVGYLLSRRK